MPTTATLLATANSGMVKAGSNVDYATARAGGSLMSTGVFARVGQDFDTPTYEVYNGLLEFDLTGIPAGSTITNTPVLSLYDNSDESTTDFDVQARLRDYGATITTADYVAGASLSALTLLAHLTTVGWTNGSYFALTDDAMGAAVAAACGSTLRIILVSSRTVAGNAPTGNESKWLYAANGTSVQDAKLVFDWTANVSPGHSSATGSATAASLNLRPAAGHASATGAAFAPSLHVVTSAGHASAEGWASEGDTTDLDIAAGVAEATGEAFAASLGVVPVAGLAEATGTAYDVLTGVGASPTAGLAEGTVAANAASASIAPSAGLASATGEAYAPSLSLGLDASLASAQASALAFDATIEVVEGTFVSAGHASATGETFAAPLNVSPNSEHAAATGAAYSPSLHIQSNADHASATVTAQQVAIALSLYPALASAIAEAYPLLANIVTTAGHASATAEAYQPAIVQPAQSGPVGSITGGGASIPGSLSGHSSPGTVTAAR